MIGLLPTVTAYVIGHKPSLVLTVRLYSPADRPLTVAVVLLPQAIGVRRAREMSMTGNFMGAEEALQFGLVNHVVAHEELIPFTRSIALDIIGNEQDGVRQMKTTYAEITAEREGWEIEARNAAAWRRTQFSPEKVEARRAAIQSRGRTQ